MLQKKENKMEFMPILVIVGSTWVFFWAVYINDTHKRIRQDIIRIKEDIRCMDEKWERLFEKLLLKEQGKGG
jgi:chromosome condensin MukBEF ATPase and DNA-binding subunit MukB